MDLKDTIIKQLSAPVKRKGTQEYMTDEDGNIVTSEAAIGMTIVQKALSGDLQAVAFVPKPSKENCKQGSLSKKLKYQGTMKQKGTLMDFFPTDREFVVELRFRQPNEETAAKIMKSMQRQTDLLPDVYVEKVHCAAHSYKQICSEDLLDGVADAYAKVTEAFSKFNSEVSSLINKDRNERVKQ